ncbi:MAG: type II secretion system protein M [Gammaproteobacteria bacterium]
MRQLWRNLQDRERLALVVGAAAVAALMFYTLFWAPINEERERLRASVAEQRELLAWMKVAAEEVRSHRSQAAAASDGEARSLLSQLESEAKAAGLSKYIKRMQPDGATGVRVWLEDLRFDEVLAWVGEVSGERAVAVKDFVADRTDREGTVNVRLVLQDQAPR